MAAMMGVLLLHVCSEFVVEVGHKIRIWMLLLDSRSASGLSIIAHFLPSFLHFSQHHMAASL